MWSAQERGADGLASDFAITTDIRQALARTDPRLDAAVTVTVYDGRVLLTGQVAGAGNEDGGGPGSPGKTRACARSMTRSRCAGNDTFWDDAKDTWIGTQVRSEMVLDPDIRGVNYMIQTENGSVYLIGMARTQRELERVTDIARRVRGVKRVVSYVEVRPGAPIAASGPGGFRPAPPPHAAAGRRSDRVAPRLPSRWRSCSMSP